MSECLVDLYLKGKEVWNKFMEEYPSTVIDFATTNFKNLTDLKYLEDLKDLEGIDTQTIDFTGYIFPTAPVFHTNNFVHSTQIKFDRAKFLRGVDFSNIDIQGSILSFHAAFFSSGHVNFSNSSFNKCILNFNDCVFSGVSNVTFSEMNCKFVKLSFKSSKFYSSPLYFDDAELTDTNVIFSRTRFIKPTSEIADNEIDRCDISYTRTNFFDSNIEFKNAVLRNQKLEFKHLRANQGVFLSTLTIFESTDIRFLSSKMEGFDIDFTDCTFNAANLSINKSILDGTLQLISSEFDSKEIVISHSQIKTRTALIGLNNKNTDIRLHNSEFSGGLVFINITANTLSLFGSTVNCFLMFNSVQAKLNLVGSQVKNHVSMQGIEIPNFETRFPQHKFWQLHKFKGILDLPWLSSKPYAPEGITEQFCRLKELAIESKNHRLEQDFFASELLASRGHETKDLALIPLSLYQLTSNFGRSLWRPCACMLFFNIYCSIFYTAYATKFDRDLLGSWAAGWLLSAAQSVPFISWTRQAKDEALKALYGTPDGAFDIPWEVHLAAGTQAVLSVIFIFLIGLALRNRFRI